MPAPLILRRPTPHKFARMTPPIPATGTSLGGAAANTVTDLPGFLAATETSSVAFWRQYISGTASVSAALNQANAAGAASMIAWGLLPASGGLAAIAAGAMDTHITAQAQLMEAFARPVYLNPWWEHNGNWYDFNTYDLNMNPRTGNTPASFVAAWRRVHDLVKAVAPTNVHMVWTPHLWGPWQPDGGTITNADYWPGDNYVDWAGFNVYPSGATFDYVAIGMQELYDLAVSHGKPLFIGEWGMEVNDPGLFAQFRDWINAHPEIRAMAYFYIDNTGFGQNYKLEAYPDVAYAVKLWLGSSKFVRQAV